LVNPESTRTHQVIFSHRHLCVEPGQRSQERFVGIGLGFTELGELLHIVILSSLQACGQHDQLLKLL
jgi:hypothetical protein